jgi:MFS family permease
MMEGMPVSSIASGIRGYRQLLSTHDVRRLVVWGLLGRLPMGMMALSLVLLVRSLGGTYAEAGLTSAANAVAAALAAPVSGRLIDRYPPRSVLIAYGLAHPVSLAVLLVLALADAPIGALVAAAFVSGACFPPIGPTVRTIWPRVTETPRQLSTAFGLEATVQELVFVSGPLIVGVLVSAFSAEAAIVTAAVLSGVGVIGFGLHPSLRERRTHAARPPHHPLAALRPGGVRLVLAFSAGLGLAFGAVEVALPAFAETHGGRSLGAVALSAWSAGSLFGGLLAGGHAPENGVRRLRILSALFVAALLVPMVADSIVTMSVLMFLAGMPIAPSFAITYGIIEHTAIPGTQAEVFGWASTAIVTGLAFGAAVGGNLITHVSVDASFLLAVLGSACAAAVALGIPAGAAPATR